MENSLNVADLQEISQTLLVTTYFRSLETKRQDGIIKDYKSVEIVDRINYDFSKHDSPINQALIAIRTEIIDKFVKNFIEQHHQVTVVNLGAGLCTRFFRVDNGLIRWIGIDLPIVESVWTNFMSETPRYKYYAYSVLDLEWMKQVKATKSGKILFIAEGLLMFLSETEVKYLIQNIRDNFADSEMIFDSLGMLLAQNSRLNSGELEIKASYKWGIKNLREIEDWGKGIELVNQWHYLSRHKNRLGWLGWLSYIPLLKRQVKIAHLRFS
ncbi:MAG: class I SAM-dependent methyltransferase [Pleurocapsa sp.]